MKKILFFSTTIAIAAIVVVNFGEIIHVLSHFAIIQGHFDLVASNGFAGIRG